MCDPFGIERTLNYSTTNHALAALYKPTKDYNKLQEKLKGMNPQQLEQFYEGLEKEG